MGSKSEPVKAVDYAAEVLRSLPQGPAPEPGPFRPKPSPIPRPVIDPGQLGLFENEKK
jgi:hypothetical protein